MHDHVSGEFLSIGKPAPNNSVYILDPDTMEPLPIGSLGVMWAGGAGITRGYINLPDKTAERYVSDPFAKDGFVFVCSYVIVVVYLLFRSMMFNTGDLG